jgi:sugar lactone lactonase YvrE
MKPLVKFFGICVLVVLGAMSILATGGGGGGDGSDVSGAPNHPFGVIAFTTGWIGVIDPNSQDVVTPLLVSELGTSGGGLFDVAITPDGLHALVSNFGDSMVNIIDTTNPSSPNVAGKVDIGFFAEDIAIVPGGRYALVTDGGFSPFVAVIDISTRSLVETLDTSPPPDLAGTAAVSHTPVFQTDGLAADEPSPIAGVYHQAVAVAPDGQTVLTVDYFQGRVNVLTFDIATGHLTYVTSLDVSPEYDGNPSIYPVNVSISPNGRTAIVAGVLGAQDEEYHPLYEYMGFPVFNINGPGDVTAGGVAPASHHLGGCQSVAFSPDGSQAYAHCTQENLVADYHLSGVVVGPPLVAAVLNVDTSTGAVTDSGIAWPTRPFGTSQLFGVDTIAMAPGGRYLFINNPTVSGGLSETNILDVTNGDLTTIPFSDTEVLDWTTPDPDDYLVAITTGIDFFTGDWY